MYVTNHLGAIMKEIKTMPWAFGKHYRYNEEQIEIETGILSKSLDRINLFDIQDITFKVSIFGWGTMTIVDNVGTHEFKWISSAKQVNEEINNVYYAKKQQMKRVDIS